MFADEGNPGFKPRFRVSPRGVSKRETLNQKI